MRYKYIAYKYTRRMRQEGAFPNVWDSLGSWSQPSSLVWRPPTDVYETADELIVVVELAGVEEDDLAVTLFSDLLVVEGRRKQQPCTEMNACHQLGIQYGDFRSEIRIPSPVGSDKVRAEYKNGLLTVTLRKLD